MDSLPVPALVPAPSTTLCISQHAAISIAPAAHGLGVAPPTHGLLEGDTLLLPAMPLVVHLRTATGCQACKAEP